MKKVAKKKEIQIDSRNFALGLHGKDFLDVFGNEHSFYQEVESSEPSVIIENVKLTEDIFLSNLSLPYPIYIESGSFKRVSFSCTFDQSFRITGGTYLLIEINGGRFYGGLSINGGTFHEFNIGGGIFYVSTTINSGHFKKGIYITDCQFKDALMLFGGRYDGAIQFVGGEFKNAVLFAGGQIRKVLFEGGRFTNGVFFSGRDFHCVSIRGGSFGQIKVLASAVIKIFDLQPSSIEFPIFLSGKVWRIYLKTLVESSGAIYVRELSISALIITKLINKGTFDVDELSPASRVTSHIAIKNSDLGNAIFKASDFSFFRKILISNSRLHNITTIGGYFPSHLDIGSVDNKPSEPERSAEAYNQLTLAMQKQGNRDKEVEYYTSYLDWQRKAYFKEKKWSAAASLWLHKHSTEYGSSWIRGALLALFLVSPLCYFLYSLTLPGVCCHFFQDGWQSGVTLHLKYFLTFLLPTHSLDFVQGIKLSWASYALDIFGRILIGFMIYQTIAAFRRYGKV